MTEAAAAPATPANSRQVSLQKIYLKDASVEIPQGAAAFTRQGQPQMDVKVDTGIDRLGNDHYQITLSVTVTTKLNNEVLFLIEAQQAGIFLVKGFDNEAEQRAVLGAYCPNVVFPFARETVADLVQRAGFPPLLLQPVNFDALYAQQLSAAAQPKAAAGAEAKPH